MPENMQKTQKLPSFTGEMWSHWISTREISTRQIAKTAKMIFAHTCEVVSRNDDLLDRARRPQPVKFEIALGFRGGLSTNSEGVRLFQWKRKVGTWSAKTAVQICRIVWTENIAVRYCTVHCSPKERNEHDLSRINDGFFRTSVCDLLLFMDSILSTKCGPVTLRGVQPWWDINFV